jgi:hypothetical protein
MLDYNQLVLLPVQNIFSRPVQFTPYGSQPGKQPYMARGVFVTTPMDVVTEANVVFSDQKTALDIRLTEYPIPPAPRDWVFVPAHMSMPAKGPFEVLDVDEFHDGRARLSLRLAQVDEPRPAI